MCGEPQASNTPEMSNRYEDVEEEGGGERGSVTHSCVVNPRQVIPLRMSIRNEDV